MPSNGHPWPARVAGSCRYGAPGTPPIGTDPGRRPHLASAGTESGLAVSRPLNFESFGQDSTCKSNCDDRNVYPVRAADKERSQAIQPNNHLDEPATHTLQDPRLTNPKQLPHQQSQVMSRHLHHVPFAHIYQPSQPRSPPTARLTDVSEAPLHQLTALLLQPLTACPPHPTSVRRR